jgi:biopolymer transport protein ExbD
MKHNPNSSLIRNLKIDLTPLVDVSFILLMAFFIVDFYRKQNVLDLEQPADYTFREPYQMSCESNTLNILIEKNHYWIHPKRFVGNLELKHFERLETELDLRTAILFQRKSVLDTSKFLVVIKPTPRCTYGDFVGVLNELKIVKSNYRLDEISERETELLAELNK